MRAAAIGRARRKVFRNVVDHGKSRYFAHVVDDFAQAVVAFGDVLTARHDRALGRSPCPPRLKVDVGQADVCHRVAHDPLNTIRSKQCGSVADHLRIGRKLRAAFRVGRDR